MRRIGRVPSRRRVRTDVSKSHLNHFNAMKHLYLILVATMIALSAAAQAPEDESTMTREQREQHHEQRVEERAVRHQNELKYMDSVVLSRNYKFVPNSFQQEPAGNMHQIYSCLLYTSDAADE